MFGLSNQNIISLRQVFEQFPSVESVKIFGSRAKGNFNVHSDIDLAVYGKNITIQTILLIKFYLEETDLPYNVDVQGYPFIRHLPLLEHIDSVGALVYQKAE